MELKKMSPLGREDEIIVEGLIEKTPATAGGGAEPDPVGDPQQEANGEGKLTTPEKIDLFWDTFIKGRMDAYGTPAPGDPSKGMCIKEPITKPLCLKHLKGEKRIGVYFLSPDILDGEGTWYVVADVDEDDLELAPTFGWHLNHLEIPCYVERSKSKGFHIWVFFSEPVKAQHARSLMKYPFDIIKEEFGYNKQEIFPKQDTIKNADGSYGLGNYIYLPLNGASVKEEKTVFLNPDGWKPYPNQWEFLSSVQRAKTEVLNDLIERGEIEGEGQSSASGTSRSFPSGRQDVPPKGTPSIITPSPTPQTGETTTANGLQADEWIKGMLSKQTKDFIRDGASEGERNDRLFKAACDFAGCAELLDTAVAVLLPAAIRSGLTQSEALATIKSAYTKPRTPSSPDALLPVVEFKNFHRTDLGNAEFMQALFGQDLRYDHTRRKWYIWAGHRWCLDRNEFSTRLAEKAVRRRLKLAAGLYDLTVDPDEKAECLTHINWAIKSENSQRINAAIELAQGLEGIATAGDEWDNDRWLLGVANGVVDLRTGEFREGRREDNITRSTTIPYDPKADAPRWNTFLLEVFDDRADLIEYIQRGVGYSLTGIIREHCLFLCYGIGRNGKTVFLNTIAGMLGDYASGTPFSTFEMSTFQSTSTNDLAALRGKRFVSARETQEAKRLNEARIKAVTGGDPITARFLYGEFFDYYPQFHVWLGVNHKPIIRDTSEGMWSRVRLIPFTVSFRGREDWTLEDKLKQELSGVLNWAVEGCLAWQKLGRLTEPKIVIAETDKYRAESDLVGVFLAECTEPKPSAILSAKALYEQYKAWCDDIGETPLSQNAFGRRLTEKGYQRENRNKCVFYKGIDLRESNPA